MVQWSMIVTAPFIQEGNILIAKVLEGQAAQPNHNPVLLSISTQKIERGNNYLVPRDFHVGSNIEWFGNHTCSVQHYHSNFFARQFSITQVISCLSLYSLNSLLHDRLVINDLNLNSLADFLYQRSCLEYNFVPFTPKPTMAKDFVDWWDAFMVKIQSEKPPPSLAWTDVGTCLD